MSHSLNATSRGWTFALALVLTVTVTATASELPPEIAADRLTVRAEWQAEDGQHAAALGTLDEVLSLREEYGLETPDAFWFRHALVANAAGEHARAVASATRYVTSAGRDGEHYMAALGLLEASDRELEAERVERERRAAAEARDAAAHQALRERLSAGEGVFSDALRSGGSGPWMVTIPAGRFRMGCLSNDDSCRDNELPAHDVTIAAPFALSVHEVTWGQWDVCVAAGGCGGTSYRVRGGEIRPFSHASWTDAQEYVAWLSSETGASYRLPSESEWEYAARAGTATRYHWGDEIDRNRVICDGCGSRWSVARRWIARETGSPSPGAACATAVRPRGPRLRARRSRRLRVRRTWVGEARPPRGRYRAFRCSFSLAVARTSPEWSRTTTAWTLAGYGIRRDQRRGASSCRESAGGASA